MKKLIIAILVAALILFGASYGLQGVAAERAQSEHLRLLKTILPGSENFTLEAYTGEDANIQAVYKGENGYVILTATQGYVDTIQVLVGVSNDGKVTGLQVRSSRETAGLGGEALTDWQFLAQFLSLFQHFLAVVELFIIDQ